MQYLLDTFDTTRNFIQIVGLGAFVVLLFVLLEIARSSWEE